MEYRVGMDSAKNAVIDQRLNAARMSQGISSDPIYAMIQGVIESENLHGDVLDYGAGIGHLTGRLLSMQRFATVSAADIMPPPTALAGRVRWIEQDLNLPLATADECFDVIVAAEVIEHLENSRLMLREMRRLLRPGGTALITTPNNESWRSIFALIARGHFVAFSDSCYPAHITALVRKDLTRMFAEAGFSTAAFHFTDYGSIPLMPRVSWQQISFGLLRGLRFSDNLLAVAKKQGWPGTS